MPGPCPSLWDPLHHSAQKSPTTGHQSNLKASPSQPKIWPTYHRRAASHTNHRRSAVLFQPAVTYNASANPDRSHPSSSRRPLSRPVPHPASRRFRVLPERTPRQTNHPFDHRPLSARATNMAGMDDFVSDSDSDYTSYWRDWVCHIFPPSPPLFLPLIHFVSNEKKNTMPANRRTSQQFISSRGNEYYCEIDEDYLTDRFNLTGLNTEVQYYQYALDLITDVFDLDCDDEMRETIEKSARHLYGLIHARYIVTTRGLAKMVCFV